ncbi:MAG: hypothetical protein M3R36_12555 [Bacteroidota bacterium]|nr:hypothetical protein [Bacteroidota bacterium]
MLRITYLKTLTILFIFVVASCNKKQEEVAENNSGNTFSWKSELKTGDIPDTPVKGFINGKEVSINYINFEQWRGSGDNVLNFGDVKPKNNCGYIENDNSFHLLRKAGEIKIGELLKANFEQNLDGYIAYYDTSSVNNISKKTSTDWSCALVITSMDDNIVKGKIAMSFKDDKKSWIAGTFEAIRCFN